MALLQLLILVLCIICHKVDARSHSQQERHQRFSRSQEVDSNINLVSRENEFDCIDIYKQPGLQHPLLKNHKIQLNPTFTRARKQYIQKDFNAGNFNGCPPGKVPIYREKMKHQMNFNSMESQIEDFPQYPRALPIERYVTLDTTPNTTYHGAYANVNICALSPLQKNQYSLGQIYAQGGPPAELNTVQAGWGVSPDLYGDSKTRLTGFWKVQGDQKSAGCFNLLCPGFIQVHQTVGFGTILQPSQTGSRIKLYLNFIIEQDDKLGNWWLTLKGNINIGYWPKDIVPHLGNGASVIRFGGETGSIFSVPNPPMGTGYLPEAKFPYACYFARLKILDSQFKEQEVNPDDMKIYRNADPKCYDLLYPGYTGEDHRQAFLYGGPGAPGDQCGPL